MPDTFSRPPLATTGEALADGYTDRLISQIHPHSISFTEVCVSMLQSLFHHITTHWPNKSNISAELQPFHHVRSELEYSNDVVLRDGYIVLPAALQQKVRKHPGMVHMKWKLRDSNWWPGLDTQLEFLIKHCEGFQHSGKSQLPDPISPISIPRLLGPWKHLGLDFAGPYSTAPHWQQFVVSIVNYYSGYPEVLLTIDIRASRRTVPSHLFGAGVH